MTTQQTVKIQLVRSPIGTKESHRGTSELVDTPEVRGMINKIAYLVRVL